MAEATEDVVLHGQHAGVDLAAQDLGESDADRLGREGVVARAVDERPGAVLTALHAAVDPLRQLDVCRLGAVVVLHAAEDVVAALDVDPHLRDERGALRRGQADLRWGVRS